jgi:NAD(P)-dependent dehydrogenase (short-subunit alcohol dehydrogenase family)
VQEAVRRTHEEFGRIDVAIANAGVLGRGGTFRTLSPQQVDGVMAVNVAGVVNTVAATLDSVINSRGQIVLVSSVFAYINGAGAIPYAMSKAAVEQLGRGLGVELASHGASAMTAYFSLIETDMIRQGVDADPHVLALLSAMPKFILKRIQPQAAAAAIADGLERRQSSITVPRRWKPAPRFEAWQDRLSTRNSRETPPYSERSPSSRTDSDAELARLQDDHRDLALSRTLI